MKPKNMIGPFVRRLRRAAGMTIEDLAQRTRKAGADFTSSDIRKIEAREIRVLDREVVVLAAALGVKAARLFGRKE